LKEYEIAEENEVLLWKFSTTKKSKCDGQHCTKPGELGTYMWVFGAWPKLDGLLKKMMASVVIFIRSRRLTA
jgi:hypothetical protein